MEDDRSRLKGEGWERETNQLLKADDTTLIEESEELQVLVDEFV